MGSPHASTSPRQRQRGVSLLESLVAFVVLALGTAAVAQLQSQLRLAGDVARERSEAVRLGQEAIEEMRSFAALDGAPGQRTYAGIASGDTSIGAASSPSAHADYRIERRIDDLAFAATKATRVAVRWRDRGGSAREVVLHSFIAGIAPAYAGSLALATGAIAGAPRGASERAPTVPLTARNLGDGRSAWKPIERGRPRWCSTTAAAPSSAAATPSPRRRQRATSPPRRWPGARPAAGCSSPERSASPRRRRRTRPPPASRRSPRAIAIALRDGDYPAPAACFSEARKTVRFLVDGSLRLDDVAADATAASAGLAGWDDTGDRFLAWHCVVAPRADGRWSGRVALVAGGWAIGTGPSEHRVCRYAEAAGDAIDANIAPAGDDAERRRRAARPQFPRRPRQRQLSRRTAHRAAPALSETATSTKAMTATSPADVTAPMREALALAAHAVGLSDPNPRVGCVIVAADGTVVGRGHTQEAGGAHAEVMALRDAAARGVDVRGATVYVTLEPCSHHGRTPPCADALVAAGVGRVVIALRDPNPLVSGRGAARLDGGRHRRRVGRRRRRIARAQHRLRLAHGARPALAAPEGRGLARRPQRARRRHEPVDHRRGGARRRPRLAQARRAPCSPASARCAKTIRASTCAWSRARASRCA